MYEERDKQEQYHWRDRLLQERRNISQSVEETLADGASQEEWTDYTFDEDVDEPSRSDTSLVPPLLSLQSKQLSAVQPSTFVQSVTAELAVQRSSKDGEKREAPQPSGILARFAQHVTSSLAAFGSVMQPTPLEHLPLSPPMPSYEERLSASPLSSLAPTPSREAQRTPSVAVVNAIPAGSSIATTPPVRSKQRLAGHTSKIRLETSPSPRITPLSKEAVTQEWGRELHETVREPLTINVRVREKPQTMPFVDSIVAVANCENEATLPPVRAENSFTSSVGTSFFGSGVFEKGQRELMVRNARTTMTSVIHITLTSNPGPTLVQFISLHPEVGFTLHLTAPTTEKTTFNYVLLADSLK